MIGGASIFANSIKDDEEFNKFGGKKKLGNQQPQIRVHHHGFRTMHDEK
jgi:hypothetical protein